MTDRHAGYIVTLAKDTREDDAKRIIDALRMIKGVASVKPVQADHALHIATERARDELRDKVYALLKELG